MRKPINLLLAPQEKLIFTESAKIDGMSLNEWVRKACYEKMGIETEETLVTVQRQFQVAIETADEADASTSTLRLAMELAMANAAALDLENAQARNLQQRQAREHIRKLTKDEIRFRDDKLTDEANARNGAAHRRAMREQREEESRRNMATGVKPMNATPRGK